MTRFVILAAPRTGSNLICTLLDSHRDVLCHHEIFNPRGIRYCLRYRNGSLNLGSVGERDAEPLMFLDRVWNTRLSHASVGFKMTRSQNDVVFDHVVHNRDIKKIVLHRRNRIKTYVSEKIAGRLDQWEVYDSSELIRARPKIHVAVDDLRRHITMNDTYYQSLETCLAENHQPWIRVSYEALWSCDEIQRLLEFLSLPPCPLAFSGIKQNSTDLRHLIQNFAEVALELRGDPLEAQLYDLDN
jgi:LPS sulfotransferase NodH